MRVFLLILAAIQTCAQTTFSPTAEFDLNGSHELRPDRAARSYFVATPNGLTWVRISQNSVIFTSADLNGHILYSTSDLASVNTQVLGALLRDDGCAWLIASGPYRLSGTSFPGDIAPYADLDLYSPNNGKHLQFLRLLSPVGGWQTPIAASHDQLVLLSADQLRPKPQSQLIHFGTVVNGAFQDRVDVRLAPPISGLSLLAPNGNLLFINKHSGAIEIIDPNAKSGSLVPPAKPQPVRAAGATTDSLYLLSSNSVLKTDFAGHLLSTYQLQFAHSFAPAALGVTSNSLYLIDNSGHVERFQID